MDNKAPRWIHGQPNSTNEMNEMNLMVQREMSNLKALKRLSLNTSVLPAQDPDLPALEISEPTDKDENGVPVSPQRSPDPSRRLSEEVAGGVVQRQPSFTRQPSLHRQSSLSKTPTFTRQPSIQRQKVSQPGIQRQSSRSSQSSDEQSLYRKHSTQSVDRTSSIQRQRSSPSLNRRASTGSGVAVTGPETHAASAYAQSPRFARHHSIVSAPNSIHRQNSAPVRSQSSTDDEPIDLLENDKNDSDIRNMWVPAGLHPELAPNEWQAFVETKLNEIRKSQEAQQQSRTNKNHSRLSHIVSDPEEYVDASAVLYQRRASSNEDKRKSILELSRDFVHENPVDDENNDDNDDDGNAYTSARPSLSNSSQSAAPSLKLGATSLRRSTHRMHKPNQERSFNGAGNTPKLPTPGSQDSRLVEGSTNTFDAPAINSDQQEKKPFSHSLRRAGRRAQMDSLSPSVSQESAPSSASVTPTVSHFSPSLNPSVSPVASTNADRQGTTAMAPSTSTTVPKRSMRTRPPLSVSVSAAKAVAQTAEQPPSPSAATPSPTASVMLGYRRRMPPKSPPAPDSNNETFQSSLITPTTPTENTAQSQNHGKTQGLQLGQLGPAREKQPKSTMPSPPMKDTPCEKEKKLPPIPRDDKIVKEEQRSQQNSDRSGLDDARNSERTDDKFKNPVKDHQNEDTFAQSAQLHSRESSYNSVPTSSAVSPQVPGTNSTKDHSRSTKESSIDGSITDKKDDKKERRWKWLDKQTQSHSEQSDNSPPMKSFASLFKKKDKSKDSKEKVPIPSSEKSTPRSPSASSLPPKHSSSVEPSTSPSQVGAADLISGSSVHRGANAHEPGAGAPEPPPHLSRRTKKGHARVQSRVSNDAENYDTDQAEHRSSTQFGSAAAAAASYNQANMSIKNGGISGTADEENMIDLNAGAVEPDGEAIMRSSTPSAPQRRDSRQNQRGSRRGGRSNSNTQEFANEAAGGSRTGAGAGAGPKAVQGKSSQQTSPVEIKLPYDIPAHQVSDRSFVMMYHRFPLHIERAIYRLSHMKLMNPRRPLHQQVLLSNFMYAYLNLINYGYQQQQLAAIEEQQQHQEQHFEDAHASSPGASTHLEESQLEQLRRIEENNYDDGMYAQSNGADEDSSSSSEEEECDNESPNKRAHISGGDSIY